MNSVEKRTLINYRLERANESLHAAQILSDQNLLIPAMNRIYYAMFYSVQALLVLDEISFSKHGQVKGFFNREYIKKGIFTKDFGKLYNTIFEYRQKFDYIDLVVPEQEMIHEYLTKAEQFILRLSVYINDSNIEK